MASPPLRPCRTPGCPALVQGRAHCPLHTRPSPGKIERGYGSGWSRISAQTIRAQPYCSICLHPGSPTNPLTADHIIPVKLGGKSTPDNLRTLCRTCNSRRGKRV